MIKRRLSKIIDKIPMFLWVVLLTIKINECVRSVYASQVAHSSSALNSSEYGKGSNSSHSSHDL